MHAALPICLAASVASAAFAAMGPIADRLALVPDTILMGFDEPGMDRKWITVNDNVMGGRSVGGFTVAAGRMVFEGATNTNGGGFSSIRTRSADFELEGTDGLLYRVKGDGRTYIAALRNGVKAGSFDISYWANFETTGDWQTVRIPYEDFRPTFFGEDITGRAPELRPSDVTGAEFYIYDKKDGPFRLEIEWIGTYTDQTPESAIATSGPTIESSHAEHNATPTAGTPEIASWATTVLAVAIDRGVPRFNAGDAGACADIYEVAIASLALHPSPLPADAKALLESGLRAGRDAKSPAQRAWAYRYAMDAALEVLNTAGRASPDRSARAD
jgi:NADH dehydrogenase [ubiquinone] 1 alpha subcomplex assembly factor 1